MAAVSGRDAKICGRCFFGLMVKYSPPLLLTDSSLRREYGNLSQLSGKRIPENPYRICHRLLRVTLTATLMDPEDYRLLLPLVTGLQNTPGHADSTNNGVKCHLPVYIHKTALKLRVSDLSARPFVLPTELWVTVLGAPSMVKLSS
jgi:hypothetical protein